MKKGYTLGQWRKLGYPDVGMIEEDVLKFKSKELKSGDKARFYCSIHGEYVREVNSHLRLLRCPQCSREEAKRNQRSLPVWLEEHVIERKDQKIDIRCPQCGKVYTKWISDAVLRKTVLCQECTPTKPRQSTIEIPEELLKLLTNTYQERYRKGLHRSSDKVSFVCNIHGRVHKRLSSFLRNPTCGLCKRIENGEALVKWAERNPEKRRLARRKAQKTCRTKSVYPPEFLERIHPQDLLDLNNLKYTHHDNLRFYCPEHGYTKQRVSDVMQGCGCYQCSRSRVSSIEMEIAEILESYGIAVVKGTKKLIKSPTGYSFEIDLYVPSKKVAIEVNGLYWHTEEKLGESYKGDPRLYHHEKTKRCEEKGILLLHIFEDDWVLRKDLCITMILSKLGLLKRQPIYARDTTFTRTEGTVLSKYHIQGLGQGQVFGLVYKGMILSEIQVKRGPSNWYEEGTYILDRYASHPEYFVIGGIEKLLKNAEKELPIKTWISYADKTISQGALYSKLGFKEKMVSRPDYKYVYRGERKHKFLFRKRRFKTDPNLIYEEGLTEKQLAKLNNIPRIWDCGKIVYEKRLGGS